MKLQNMLRIEIRQKIDSVYWNNLLTKNNISSSYQSYEFAESYRITYNSKPFFILIKNDDDIVVGQLLVFIHNEYFWKDSNKLSQIIKNMIKTNSLLGWFYGPIIYDDKNANQITIEILRAIEKIAQENHVLIIRGASVPSKSFSQVELFKKNGYKTQEWATFLINFQRSKAEIQNNFDKKSVSKNIKRSMERGVKIEEITEKNLEEYVKILSDFNVKTHRTKSSFNKVKNHLKPFQSTIKGFLARKNSIPIGGILFFCFNKFIIEQSIARTKSDDDEKLYSQDLLKWNIIDWGIKNSMNFFDLNGFNPAPISKKEEGILQYKKKWGGEKFPYFILTKIPNKKKYQIMMALMHPYRIKSKIKQRHYILF